MKREMILLADRVSFVEMDRILTLAKALYPRHKFVAYQVKPLYNGEKRKYSVKYNLTESEYHTLCDAYVKGGV